MQPAMCILSCPANHVKCGMWSQCQVVDFIALSAALYSAGNDELWRISAAVR